jgi:flavin reductase (DIM6/NTAB) family NADH-FMN oxidoreductase RutF
MVDPIEFRNAMGNFATGVTVVTFAVDGADHGITVNSFASLSLDPPLVLWNCDEDADSHDLLERADSYAVNVLSAEQEWLSSRFAGEHKEMDDPFHDVAFTRGDTGAPLIEGCLATADCHITERYPGGDHTIYVGEVRDVAVGEPADPLLFFRGEYRDIA